MLGYRTQVESGGYIFPLGLYFKFAMLLRTSGTKDRLEGLRRTIFLENISSNTKDIFLDIKHQVESGGNKFPLRNNFPPEKVEFIPLGLFVEKFLRSREYFFFVINNFQCP